MTNQAKCPACGAEGDELRLIGKSKTAPSGVGVSAEIPIPRVVAYQCKKCGMGFAFSESAGGKPP